MLENSPHRERDCGIRPPLPLMPFNSGRLRCPGHAGHSLYFAEYGDPRAPAVLLVHGTALPFSEDQLRFIQGVPARVILFHQRGVGLSEPRGEVLENSIPHTVSDMEALRKELGIQSWHVMGWSLGTTISTAYAQAHPELCRSLLFYGVFLGTVSEYRSMLENDLAANPVKWRDVSELATAPLTADRLPQIIEVLYRHFCDQRPEVRHKAMGAWLQRANGMPISKAEEDYLRVNFHYRVNSYFVDPVQMQAQLPVLRSIPTMILSGARDNLVPAESAHRVAEGHGAARVISVDDDHFMRGSESQAIIAASLKHLLSP